MKIIIEPPDYFDEVRKLPWIVVEANASVGKSSSLNKSLVWHICDNTVDRPIWFLDSSILQTIHVKILWHSLTILQFEHACCFRSGCRICSHRIKNNNASAIQSAVWSCSSEIERISCVGMWQWMKHGSTTTHLNQKDRQLNGQQPVKVVQSDQKLKSQLAR